MFGAAANVKAQQSGNADAPSSEERSEILSGFRGLYGLCGCFLRTQQRVFDFLQAMFVLAPSHGGLPAFGGVGWRVQGFFDWPPCGAVGQDCFPGLPASLCGGGCLDLYGEFDPGSGRTLAACLTHASRAVRPLRGYTSGERVSNT